MIRDRTISILTLIFLSSVSLGQEKATPLKPPDRSSPRATLKTFLESVDAVGAFIADEYRSAPTQAGFHHLLSLAEIPVQCLDLREIPPASHMKTGNAAAITLYETLNRIDLPPFDQVPGADDLKSLAATDPPRWVIPDTQIALVFVTSGPHSGEFLFSSATVAGADASYHRVRALPYIKHLDAGKRFDNGFRPLQSVMVPWRIPRAENRRMVLRERAGPEGLSEPFATRAEARRAYPNSD
jgi:MscS family membrane protein